MTLRIGIVVGEISGDNLAVSLIRSLKHYHPDLIFEGILGPELVKEGGCLLYPMERLAVMGLIEPLGRLPELLRIRRELAKNFIKNPPDLFIGVDAPDFNLGLEKKLKRHGIPTIHYVSPSVWAWRQGRIKLIKKAVDLMLTLFPFEQNFYVQHKVPVCFSGHPLADSIPLEIDTKAARRRLNLEEDKPVLLLLPGSRNHELKYLAKIFLLTAMRCYQNRADLQLVAAVVSEPHKMQLLQLQQTLASHLSLKIVVGDSHTAMAAAEVALVTSGTATLEMMLHKKPLVVAYRMHALTYQIAKRLVKVPYIALPNLLAEERLIPEYIQEQATPEKLSKALLQYLSPLFDKTPLVTRFKELHVLLQKNASEAAAKAIEDLRLHRV